MNTRIQAIRRRNEIERFRMAQRDYFEMSRPIIREMTIYGTPRMLVKDGTVISHETIYTPAQESLLNACREHLEQSMDSLLKAYGLEDIRAKTEGINEP